MSKTLSNKTDDYQITAGDANGSKIFTNIGASKDILFLLPFHTNGLEVDITNNLLGYNYKVEVAGKIVKVEPEGTIDYSYGAQVNFKADGTKWTATQVTLAEEILEYFNINSTMNSFFIDGTGKAWTWGQYTVGQLGNNDDTTVQSTPVAVCLDYTWKQLAVAEEFTLGIDYQGKGWAWGGGGMFGQFGQLGVNDTNNYSTPVAVCLDYTWKQLANSSNRYSLGIDYQGKGWAWGTNAQAELGTGDTTAQSTPIAICDNYTWSQISAGWQHAAGIDYQGKAWSWGYNGFGELGNNDASGGYFYTPTAVCLDITFKQITAGYFYTLGIDYQGKAWGWGWNDTAVLGNNSVLSRSTPVAVCLDFTWKEISAGVGGHVLGVDINKQGWAWGINDRGCLGINDSAATVYSTPIAICGNHSWKYLSAGSIYSLAIDSDSEVWAWGNNQSYQLGTNNDVCYSTPVAVCKKW